MDNDNKAAEQSPKEDTPTTKRETFKANIIRATPDMKVPDVPSPDNIKIPKRLESKNANGKIRRPRNAFIIFRSHQHKTFVDSFIKDNKPVPHNSEISKMIGAQWKSLTPAEKQVWVDAADKERTDHLTKHPDYKYQPVRRKVKKELKEKEKVLKKNKLKVYNAIEKQNKQAELENQNVHEEGNFQYFSPPTLKAKSIKNELKDGKDDNFNKGFSNLYEMNQLNQTNHLNHNNQMAAGLRENSNGGNGHINYLQQGANSQSNVAIDRFQMEQFQQLKQLEQLKQMEQIRYLQQQQYMMMQQQMMSQQAQHLETTTSNTKNNSNNEGFEATQPVGDFYQRVPAQQPYAPVSQVVVDRRGVEEDNAQFEDGQPPMTNPYLQQQQYYMYLQEQQANKPYQQDVGYEYYYPQNENVPAYNNFVGFQNYQQPEGTPPKQPQQQNTQYIPQQQYGQYYNNGVQQQQGYYYRNEYPQGDEYNA